MSEEPAVCRRAVALARRIAAGAAAFGALIGLPPAAGAVTAGGLDEIAALRAQAVRYEHGEGVAKDEERAVALYCRAARLGDAEAQFSLGWMYANGRGVERNDAWAAYFVHAAAEQGISQAVRLLSSTGEPNGDVPPCMREPRRALVAEGAAALPVAPIRAPKAIAEIVQRLAPEYRVEPQLVLAIIKAESNFDAVALSPKNAMGLMQLIPETAARFKVKDPYDPKQNIRGGLAYLRWLLAYFEGDVSLVAAAYNAGEGTVDRYRGVPPYLETRSYVRRIVEAIGGAAHPYDASVTRPSPQLRSIQAASTAK